MTAVGVAIPARSLTLTRLGLESPAWLECVAGMEGATVFHHPAWARVVTEGYGFRSFGLASRDERGQVTAGLPVVEIKGPLGGTRWVSLPFTDSCPPLIRDGSQEQFVRLLWEEARSRGVSAVHARAPLPPQNDIYSVPEGVIHTLAIDADPDVTYRRISKMHRRNIAKAERSGVVVERGTSMRDVDAFYRLHVLTRQRLGVPVQPRRFFTSLHRHILQQNLGFVLTATLEGRPIASAVFLGWNGVLIYKYGASDRQFREYRPNNRIFWEAIRWAAEHGYHTLDWGRTDFEDVGLRSFKTGWGAVERPLVYSTIGSVPPRESTNRGREVISTVIRRSPPWVARVIGEVLYRYAA